jgi:hypothetical protein
MRVLDFSIYLIFPTASNRNEYFLGLKCVRLALKADITAICEPGVYKTWEPRRLTATHILASKTRYRDSFTFFYLACSFVWVKVGT